MNLAFKLLAGAGFVSAVVLGGVAWAVDNPIIAAPAHYTQRDAHVVEVNAQWYVYTPERPQRVPEYGKTPDNEPFTWSYTMPGAVQASAMQYVRYVRAGG